MCNVTSWGFLLRMTSMLGWRCSSVGECLSSQRERDTERERERERDREREREN
jgi:hypothetical protein